MTDYLTRSSKRTEDPVRLDELDAAREKAGQCPVSDSIGDYWTAMQTLRLAVMNLNLADDAGHPLRSESEILKQVDRARQALQIVACTAQFVGRKQ